jgi:NitT/TauT family transport system ATP-binding protein
MNSESINSIKVDCLEHFFEKKRVLNNISFSFPVGSLIAVLGPSGCGKTTLLKCLSGLIYPSSGTVSLNGNTPRELRKTGKISFAFQTPTLLPWRTVLENVLLPIEILRGHVSISDRDYAIELLKNVELEKDTLLWPHELSGGMQQRVELARSLVSQPEFLFLDEPFGALDGLTRDKLNESVRYLWEKKKITIVFVTHSIPEAIYLADYILVFSQRPARIVHTEKIEMGVNRPSTIRLSNLYWDYQKKLTSITQDRL